MIIVGIVTQAQSHNENLCHNDMPCSSDSVLDCCVFGRDTIMVLCAVRAVFFDSTRRQLLTFR